MVVGDGLLWASDLARPLRRPLLVAAFTGWNDAGDAASSAANHLIEAAPSTVLAEVEPDEHLDYQVYRPHVQVVGGVARSITWPANRYHVVAFAERDVVVLAGVEPTIRWRSFCANVLEVVRRTGTEMVVTFGALLGDTPHTRPVELTGSATHAAVRGPVSLTPSMYEGPTGIVGVLHAECRTHGVPAVSLWAPVPHYAAAPPNPPATVALLDGFADVSEVAIDVTALREASLRWTVEIDQAVSEHDALSDYVRSLEERNDESERGEGTLPTGDELAAELERFLRRQGGADGDAT